MSLRGLSPQSNLIKIASLRFALEVTTYRSVRVVRNERIENI